MERYRGKSVSPNIAIGRIWFYEKEKCQIEKRAISDSAAEWKRYEDARNTARDQLKELMRKIEEEVGETKCGDFRCARASHGGCGLQCVYPSYD